MSNTDPQAKADGVARLLGMILLALALSCGLILGTARFLELGAVMLAFLLPLLVFVYFALRKPSKTHYRSAISYATILGLAVFLMTLVGALFSGRIESIGWGNAIAVGLVAGSVATSTAILFVAVYWLIQRLRRSNH